MPTPVLDASDPTLPYTTKSARPRIITATAILAIVVSFASAAASLYVLGTLMRYGVALLLIMIGRRVTLHLSDAAFNIIYYESFASIIAAAYLFALGILLLLHYRPLRLLNIYIATKLLLALASGIGTAWFLHNFHAALDSLPPATTSPATTPTPTPPPTLFTTDLLQGLLLTTTGAAFPIALHFTLRTRQARTYFTTP